MSDNLVCCSESAVRHQAPCGLLYPIIAHLSDNVNFLPDNVKRHNVANRSHNAVGRARNAQRRHRLGDRNSCLGDRNSCRPNRAPQTASHLSPRQSPFLRLRHLNFNNFNHLPPRPSSLCYLMSISNPPCLRYFRPRVLLVDFAPLLEVNMCYVQHCTHVATALRTLR